MNLNVDENLVDGEEPRPLGVSSGYNLVLSPPAVFDASLVNRLVVLRRGVGWLGGFITRQA